MHKKVIKFQVRKQLKKKGIAQKILGEVVSDYNYPKERVPSDLLGISDQQPTKGILTIDEMAAFVESEQKGSLFNLHGNHKTLNESKT